MRVDVNKSGNSSLHLRAKGGVVPPSVSTYLLFSCEHQIYSSHSFKSFFFTSTVVILDLSTGIMHFKKIVSNFPVPSRDVTNQTLPGRE